MARIIGGGTFGEMRGKLGSNVFSRNRSGAIIRQYIIPVDVRSTAQLNARASFGSASSSWHSLTSTEKVAWQDFADLGYNPKHATNNGQYSGFQARTALANVVANATRFGHSGQLITFNGSGVVTPTVLPFVARRTPPSDGIRNSFQSNVDPGILAELQVTQGLSNCEISAGSATFEVNLSFSQLVDMAAGIPLRDTGGNNIGFAIYGSSPVSQQQNSVRNDDFIAFAVFPAFSITAGETDISTIKLTGPMATNVADLHKFYKAGDFVRISVYLVSDAGQMMKIGSTMCEVAV